MLDSLKDSLSAAFDVNNIKSVGMTMAGGAGAGALYGLARANFPWLKSGGSDTEKMLKAGGLAVGVAVLADMFLADRSAEMAQGAVGAMGLVVGDMLLRKLGVMTDSTLASGSVSQLRGTSVQSDQHHPLMGTVTSTPEMLSPLSRAQVAAIAA